MESLPPIKPDQRVLFVGRTGSGKTYLARALLANNDRLLVFDSKGTLNEASGWNLETWNDKSSETILNPDSTFRYRILTPETGDWETYLWAAYYAQDVTIYIDEVYGVEEGTKPSLGLRAVITRGRELGIGVWCATQRPSYVPLIIMTEADWIFEFQLRLLDDRKRIASMIGPAGLRELRNHQVIVFNDKMNDPVFFQQAKVREYRVKGKADVEEGGSFEPKDRFGGGNKSSFSRSA